MEIKFELPFFYSGTVCRKWYCCCSGLYMNVLQAGNTQLELKHSASARTMTRFGFSCQNVAWTPRRHWLSRRTPVPQIPQIPPIPPDTPNPCQSAGAFSGPAALELAQHTRSPHVQHVRVCVHKTLVCTLTHTHISVSSARVTHLFYPQVSSWFFFFFCVWLKFLAPQQPNCHKLWRGNCF